MAGVSNFWLDPWLSSTPFINVALPSADINGVKMVGI